MEREEEKQCPGLGNDDIRKTIFSTWEPWPFASGREEEISGDWNEGRHFENEKREIEG